MPSRRSYPSRVTALTGLVVTLVLVGSLSSPAALAQVVDIPPGSEELGTSDNWTFKLMAALAALSLLVLLGTVAGYVVKARGFKDNAKRGGAK